MLCCLWGQFLGSMLPQNQFYFMWAVGGEPGVMLCHSLRLLRRSFPCQDPAALDGCTPALCTHTALGIQNNSATPVQQLKLLFYFGNPPPLWTPLYRPHFLCLWSFSPNIQGLQYATVPKNPHSIF